MKEDVCAIWNTSNLHDKEILLNSIRTGFNKSQTDNPLLTNFKHIHTYLLRPVHFFQTYKRSNLQPDLMAGLTVGVIALPQTMAFALIAELPPVMGLYTVIVGAVVAALWGSSHQTHSGPANAVSILVLSVLATVAMPGSPEFIVAAGVLAVMAGVFQLIIGLSRLGILVNFVSHSVIIGFSAGAGALIAINQVRHLLGLTFSSHSLAETIQEIFRHLLVIHWPTAILGLGTMGLIILSRKLWPKAPGRLFGMVIASALVFFLGLDKIGVDVIGSLPGRLPPLVKLPLFDLNLLNQLSTGALAVGIIGLIQTTAIARSITAQTGQRLDSNQEFVGQGLANIACGFFSGYSGAASFSRSAVNLETGAQTSMSAIFSSIFVLIAMFTLAPLAAYLPRAALAGVLIVTAVGLIDRAEIARIWRGTLGDTVIMIATLLATLFLPLQFAVLIGVLFSFARYLIKTSMPRVYSVLPDEGYEHFVQQQPHQSFCPQLGILKISGDLYFGAVNHIEEAIKQHLADHPEQYLLLLRMQGVNQCDLRGVQMLEAIRHTCQERGGDLFLMKVQQPVYDSLKSTGFYNQLGDDHFLEGDYEAISQLFYNALDSAICIYECDARVFAECQNLPRQSYLTDIPPEAIINISPRQLRQKLRNNTLLLIIDVREPREFRQGHISQAQLIPLPRIVSDMADISCDREIVFVSRSGRRSAYAAYMLQKKGCRQAYVLQGGMIAWQTTELE